MCGRGAILLLGLLAVAPGCGDGSVRGAGSIDIPKESRKSYVPTKFDPPKYEPKAPSPPAAP